MVSEIAIVFGIGVAVAGAAGALVVVGARREPASKPIDPAVVAAIAAAVSAQYPGSRITRIEAEP
jgi:hypothetical protein